MISLKEKYRTYEVVSEHGPLTDAMHDKIIKLIHNTDGCAILWKILDYNMDNDTFDQAMLIQIEEHVSVTNLGDKIREVLLEGI